MGTRGPKPNPASHRSQRRGVKAFASGSSGRTPKMPRHLEPAGQRLWRRVVEELKQRKAIGRLHIDALTDACEMADEIDSLKRNIRLKGLTYVGPNGAECLRPEVKQLNTLRRQMQFYQREFGLTPSADERLHGAPETEEEDDALNMLATLGATPN